MFCCWGSGKSLAVHFEHLCTSLFFPNQKRSQRPKRNPLPSFTELLLPRTCFCCHPLLAKGRNKHWGLAGLGALACRMGKRHSWSSARGQGSAPRPCQIFQLRFRCSAHAEGTVLGIGSTPGCWAVNPAGDARKGGGNSWSRTQSYVNPCMLLRLSLASREKRRSQRCPERFFPKNA